MLKNAFWEYPELSARALAAKWDKISYRKLVGLELPVESEESSVGAGVAGGGVEDGGVVVAVADEEVSDDEVLEVVELSVEFVESSGLVLDDEVSGVEVATVNPVEVAIMRPDELERLPPPEEELPDDVCVEEVC